jgi:hypothetical protein
MRPGRNCYWVSTYAWLRIEGERGDGRRERRDRKQQGRKRRGGKEKEEKAMLRIKEQRRGLKE